MYVTSVNMASTEDENNLRYSEQISDYCREVDIINIYKELEQTLNNRTESFQNKVESLIEVWKQVSQYHLTEDEGFVTHVMDWLKLHTLNIVLTGDWRKSKDVNEERLLNEVKHCEMILSHSNSIFSLRCKKLADIIKDPWGSPVLSRLLNDSDNDIGPEEMDFFSSETGYLISTRLRKLCESHCEDMALNLVSAFMKCYELAEIQNTSLNATEDQQRFILDVYIALLYKFKKTSLMISTLKSLTVQRGLDLLKRFVNKRITISKIWKHSNRIAHLAAQVYVTAVVLQAAEEEENILQELLETWFCVPEGFEDLHSLKSVIRRIIQTAEYAVQIYIFCDVIHKKFGASMKPFVIELYIRALTANMNELERQKEANNACKVSVMTKRLSVEFLNLADVLQDNLKVSRECVLTSFSLQPTPETLDRILQLAKLSGYPVLDTGQSWKCKLHPPTIPSDDISWPCDSCGEYMTEPNFEAPINTNMALNEALSAEQLGLTSHLCDDLVVVLSSPRYQLFNWTLKWRDLHTLCVLYLNDPERTKNLVTELKFVAIDYSIFFAMKREPEDEEYPGIEHGYEGYLEENLYPEERVGSNSSDEENVCNDPRNLGSDGTEENLILLPPPMKSDPDVLKSLRLFRPNLKRTKPLQNELPSKVFVTTPSSSNVSSPNYFSPTPPLKVSGTQDRSHISSPNYVTPTPPFKDARTHDRPDIPSPNFVTPTPPFKDVRTLDRFNVSSPNYVTPTPSLKDARMHERSHISSPNFVTPTPSLKDARTHDRFNVFPPNYVTPMPPLKDVRTYDEPNVSSRNYVAPTPSLKDGRMHDRSNVSSPLKDARTHDRFNVCSPNYVTPVPPLKDVRTYDGPNVSSPNYVTPTPPLKDSRTHDRFNVSSPNYVTPTPPLKDARTHDRFNVSSPNYVTPTPPLKDVETHDRSITEPDNTGFGNSNHSRSNFLEILRDTEEENKVHDLRISPCDLRVTKSRLNNCLETQPYIKEQEAPYDLRILQDNDPHLSLVNNSPTLIQSSEFLEQPAVNNSNTNCANKNVVMETSNVKTNELTCTFLWEETQKLNPIEELKNKVTSPEKLVSVSSSNKFKQVDPKDFQFTPDLTTPKIKVKDDLQLPVYKQESAVLSNYIDPNSSVKKSKNKLKRSMMSTSTSLTNKVNRLESNHFQLTPNSTVTQTPVGDKNFKEQLPVSAQESTASSKLIDPQINNKNVKNKAATCTESTVSSKPINPQINNKNVKNKAARCTESTGSSKPIDPQMNSKNVKNKAARCTESTVSSKPIDPQMNIKNVKNKAARCTESTVSSKPIDPQMNSKNVNNKAAICTESTISSKPTDPQMNSKNVKSKAARCTESTVSSKLIEPQINNKNGENKAASCTISNSTDFKFKQLDTESNLFTTNSTIAKIAVGARNNKRQLRRNADLVLEADDSRFTQSSTFEKPSIAVKNFKEHELVCIPERIQESSQHIKSNDQELESRATWWVSSESTPVTKELKLFEDKDPQFKPSSTLKKIPIDVKNSLEQSSGCTQESSVLFGESESKYHKELENESPKCSMPVDLSNSVFSTHQLLSMILKSGTCRPRIDNEQGQPADESNIQIRVDRISDHQSQSGGRGPIIVKYEVRQPALNNDNVKPESQSTQGATVLAAKKDSEKRELQSSQDAAILAAKKQNEKRKSQSSRGDTVLGAKKRNERRESQSSRGDSVLAAKKRKGRRESQSSRGDAVLVAKKRKERRESQASRGDAVLAAKKRNERRESQSSRGVAVLVAKKRNESRESQSSQDAILNEDFEKTVSQIMQTSKIIIEKTGDSSEDEVFQFVASNSSSSRGQVVRKIVSEASNGQCLNFKEERGILSLTGDRDSQVLAQTLDANGDCIGSKVSLETNCSKIKDTKNPISNELEESIRESQSHAPKNLFDLASTSSDDESQLLPNIEHSANLRALYKQFNIKEFSVVLQRVVLPQNRKTIKASRYLKLLSLNKKNCKLRKTMRSENKEISLSKGEKADRNAFWKPWPLQDINPKVNFRTNDSGAKLMNPCVLLKRLEFESDDKKKNQNAILSGVPGLNDLQMIRPSSVDRIVQVVQVPGSRCTTSVPIPSTQTSTQVSPHIQRIGQPRNEKCEISAPDTSTTNSVNTVSTATSESPTLINILSQQIIRPSNQGSINVKPRSSPLINILSQQIIKPATSTSTTTKVQPTGNEVQVNNIPRVISGGDQIINQLVNPSRAPVPALKTLVSSPTSDQNRIVQFICKSSDGKLIPVTSFTSNKVVKVSMTQTVNTSMASNSEENSTKIIQTTSTTKAESDSSDTLPKFQQAFGKATYQNNVESPECTIVSDTDVEKVEAKCDPPKNSSGSLNVQPVQGGVIYRQLPVAQTINLLPPGRGQVFRIATSNAEQLSFVKDTVIHGKMSALLAAALQGKQRTVESTESESNSEENSTTSTKVALTTRPMLVQSARIVKPVIQIPSNVIRTAPQSQSSSLSSTTLEQLREFDMVYKQVKERSSGSAPIEASPQSDSNESAPQQISVTYLNQTQKISCAPVVVVSSYCSVQPAASPALSVTSQGSSSPCVTPAPTLSLTKVATKSPKPKTIKSTTTHASKASPIPKPQQKPQEDEHTTQRIFDILAEYAEQLRNSPDLNNKPAPRRRSNPPTNPNQNAKRKKSSSSKKSGNCSNSLTSDGDADDSHMIESEDSSCGVVQISMQDDDQQPNCSESNETSATSPKPIVVNDTTTTTQSQSRSLVITDSNVSGTLKMSNTAVLVPGNYIMPVSMVKGGQQIAVVSGGSKILATVPARAGPNMLLFQSFLNQTKKPTNMPTLKYSTVQPISGITRNVTNITSQIPNTTVSSQNLTAVTLSQTVALQKVTQIESSNRQNFETELLLTIAHQSDVKSKDETQVKEKETEKKTFQFDEKLISTSVATSVIAQPISIKEGLLEDEATKSQSVMALNLNESENDKDATMKVQGRVQSVLVATGTSNGPMLSNSPPSFNKQSDCTNSESNKDEYLHNDGKPNISDDSKSLQTYSYQGKIKKIPVQRLDRDLHHLSLQRKQAALERELHLQKSLSEECEDLGVDEPSTSDLFPEADLLFDSNHSPSFDQTSQDLIKRHSTVEAKDDNKNIGIFCDDEPLRSDFLFEPLDYQNSTIELDYDRSRDVSKRPGEAGYLNEDNTLLQTCPSVSDVTIPSPISPDSYTDNSPQHLSKCKYKYSNRKKMERKQVENWPLDMSSSEDTTGSAELVKSCSRSPEDYPNKVGCDEEYYGYTLLERVPIKDEEEGCQGSRCIKNNCGSGRGARRSVKKLCSCCNGSADITRKPNTPLAPKKSVFAKKR